MGKVSTFKSQVDNLNFDKIISGQVVISKEKKIQYYGMSIIKHLYLFFSFLFYNNKMGRKFEHNFSNMEKYVDIT